MKVDLNKWYKCDIDKQVYQNLIKRSDWQGIKHVSLWIIVLVFSGYMAFINWGTWWAVFWFFVYGNIYMSSNPIWHDCGHGSAFKSRWLNEIFYQITSFTAAPTPDSDSIFINIRSGFYDGFRRGRLILRSKNSDLAINTLAPIPASRSRRSTVIDTHNKVPLLGNQLVP